jgi:hypothetical protein
MGVPIPRLGKVVALYNNKQNSIAEICQTLKISRATLYRALKIWERDQSSAG